MRKWNYPVDPYTLGTSIVTVSAVGDAGEQEIHLWDLASGREHEQWRP